MNVTNPDDLRREGVDVTRGVTLAFFDFSGAKYAFELPVSNRTRFEVFARTVLTTPALVNLTTIKNGKTLRAIRIESDKSQGVRICSLSDGKASSVAPGRDIPVNELQSTDSEIFASLNVVPDGSAQPAQLSLTCSAQYADGAVGVCSCRVNDQDCGKPFKIKMPETLSLGEGRPTALRFDGATLTFPSQDIAVIGDSSESVLSSIRKKENFEFFRSDDTFGAASRLVLDAESAGDGTIFGAVNIPILPISGRTYFGATFGPRRAILRVAVPLQDMGTTALMDLLTPSPHTWNPPRALLPDGVKIAIDDPALGSYLNIANEIRGAPAAFEQAFGNFDTFIKAIPRTPNDGQLRVVAFRLREGVPDVVMALSISQSNALKLISEQRTSLRRARDEEIICAAANNYAEANHEAPERIDQLGQYLKSEPGAAWSLYTIHGANAEQDESGKECRNERQSANSPVAIVAAAFSPELFSGPTYNTEYRGRRIEYIPPAFTLNDELYRLKIKGGAQVDIAALRNNRFRLAAYYNDHAHALIVGTDLGALQPIIDRDLSEGRRTAQLYEQDGMINDSASSKISVSTDGRWLITQGLLYPNKQVKDFVEKYLLDLEQYRHLDVHVTPKLADHVLIGTATLRHD
ncbi:MAG: hypothetical protein ACM3SP_14270 [Chloroflexota bacterium]